MALRDLAGGYPYASEIRQAIYREVVNLLKGFKEEPFDDDTRAFNEKVTKIYEDHLNRIISKLFLFIYDNDTKAINADYQMCRFFSKDEIQPSLFYVKEERHKILAGLLQALETIGWDSNTLMQQVIKDVT